MNPERSLPKVASWAVQLTTFCLACNLLLAGALQVGPSGAHLHLRKDERSPTVEILEPDAILTQLVETIGATAWHLVRTESGRTGWVRAADVVKVRKSEPTSSTDESTIRFGSGSTWSARTRGGRVLGGTWTGGGDLSTGTAQGTWTLLGPSGRTQMRGAWSASKAQDGWRGAWRANVSGQRGERSGSWSSRVQLASDGSFADLFELAVSQSVDGAWRSGAQSGSWSIRAVR